MVILVTTDNLFLRYFLVQTLRQDGHLVLQANDSQAAVSAAVKHDARIDLLITAHNGAIYGLQLRRRLSEETANLKTIVMLDGPSKIETVHRERLPVLVTPFTATALRGIVSDTAGPPKVEPASDS